MQVGRYIYMVSKKQMNVDGIYFQKPVKPHISVACQQILFLGMMSSFALLLESTVW